MNDHDSTADREIVITRVFNAPRTVVFQAFTDPKHVDHWYGPRGFKTETTDMDVRPGGAWNFVMRGAGIGAQQYCEFKNRVVYRKVVRPERLEYTHDSGVDGDPSAFEVTIVFEDFRKANQGHDALGVFIGCRSRARQGVRRRGRGTSDAGAPRGVARNRTRLSRSLDQAPAPQVAGPHAAVHSLRRVTRELSNDARDSAGLDRDRDGAPARRRM